MARRIQSGFWSLAAGSVAFASQTLARQESAKSEISFRISPNCRRLPEPMWKPR